MKTQGSSIKLTTLPEALSEIMTWSKSSLSFIHSHSASQNVSTLSRPLLMWTLRVLARTRSCCYLCAPMSGTPLILRIPRASTLWPHSTSKRDERYGCVKEVIRETFHTRCMWSQRKSDPKSNWGAPSIFFSLINLFSAFNAHRTGFIRLIPRSFSLPVGGSLAGSAELP